MSAQLLGHEEWPLSMLAKLVEAAERDRGFHLERCGVCRIESALEPSCPDCGTPMRMGDACFRCPNCGCTSGVRSCVALEQHDARLRKLEGQAASLAVALFLREGARS